MTLRKNVVSLAVVATVLAVIAGKAIVAGKFIGKEVAIAAAAIFLLNGVAGATLFNYTFLREAENLHDRDLKARSARYTGSYAAVGFCSAAVYDMISTVGSVAGDNILASIGSSLGGGMLLGAVTVIVAPVAIVAAVGGAIYRVVKFREDGR